LNRLSYWRAKRELTVRELAEKTKLSPTTINRLENGHIKSTVVTLGRLANALDIDVTELAELAEHPKTCALTELKTRAQGNRRAIETRPL
jgi:transcriptional regulator with XRE-family HTH domain